MKSHSYSADFYRGIKTRARNSAREIVPYINKLISPKSVVDVGCGVGTWLTVFKEFGISDIAGMDGSYIDRSMLEIPESCFQVADLTESFPVRRRFNLALSLEVAEHLPLDNAAGFIRQLTSLSDVILFSAAIPNQGGTHHVNEQWPAYWAEMFQAHGFVALDCLRQRFWNNANVAWWYAQNMLLFVKVDRLTDDIELKRLQSTDDAAPLGLVHPRKFNEAVWDGVFWRSLANIREIVPADADFILIDEGNFFDHAADDRHIIPFPERDGQYFGLPADDSAAIDEIVRLHDRGAEYVVILWPAFWWLDHYAKFHHYLNEHCSLIRDNERMKIMKIR